MYNERKKREFIEEYTTSTNTAKVAARIFEALAKYEELYQKDICAMPIEELQPTINSVIGLRSGSKEMSVSVVKEYVKWCVSNNFPDAVDNMDSVDLQGLDKVKTHMVANPTHLQRALDELFDSESEETMDNINRCYFWLAYSGFPEDSVFSLESDMVNIQSMVVCLGDSEYPLYKESIPAFSNIIHLTSFNYKHPRYNQDIVRDRVLGSKLFRGVKADAEATTFNSMLSKKCRLAYKSGKTNFQLSYKRVCLSGLFYRMYERERAGFDVDFDDKDLTILIEQTEDKEKRANLKRMRRVRSQEYLEDYKRWKLAFLV